MLGVMPEAAVTATAGDACFNDNSERCAFFDTDSDGVSSDSFIFLVVIVVVKAVPMVSTARVVVLGMVGVASVTCRGDGVEGSGGCGNSRCHLSMIH